MKITIDVLENESNKDNLEYLIYEQFLETITRIWGYMNEDN